MISRRSVCSGVATAFASGFLPTIRRARAAESFTFFTPFGLSPEFIDVMNAKSGGFFEREGLIANIRDAQGTAQAMQQLVSGQCDFLRVAPLDQMRLVAKQKVPVICIATAEHSSNFFLIFSGDKPLASVADLRGKTVGVLSNGGITQLYLQLMLKTAGLSLADVTIQVTPNSPGSFDFIKQGRLEAFVGTLAVIEPLERRKENVQYWSTDRFAPAPCQAYMTMATTIERRPELVTRFLKAMYGSVQEILFQPQEPLFRRAMRDFDIFGTRDINDALAVTGKRWQELWLSQGRENLLRNVPSLWAQGADAMRKAGLIDIAEPEVFYTNRFIDQLIKT